MPPLERPNCEYGGIGGCARPATHFVCFQSRRWRLSCDSHRERTISFKECWHIGSLLFCLHSSQSRFSLFHLSFQRGDVLRHHHLVVSRPILGRLGEPPPASRGSR